MLLLKTMYKDKLNFLINLKDIGNHQFAKYLYKNCRNVITSLEKHYKPLLLTLYTQIHNTILVLHHFLISIGLFMILFILV